MMLDWDAHKQKSWTLPGSQDVELKTTAAFVKCQLKKTVTETDIYKQ